jgi:hypothetical protein
MWRRVLSIGLAFGLLCAPLSALPSQPPPPGSVTLSPDEYAQILAAMESAKTSLERSNETIKDQSTALTRLWIFSGVLALGVLVESVALARLASK